MLVNEAGPFDLFISLREITGIKHDSDGEIVSWPPGNPLACMLCTSVWIALLLLVVPDGVKRVMAVSGLASLLQLKR